jgi:hypothetical protein
MLTIAKFNCRFRSDNLLFQPAKTSVYRDRKTARNRQLNLAYPLALIQKTHTHYYEQIK